MNKTKWIVGLSIAGVMALSGTAFALNSGSYVAHSTGQTPGLAPTTAITESRGTVSDTNGISPVNSSSPTTSQPANTAPSSLKISANDGITKGDNGFAGGYGMMGGYGANGTGGGYGMMGGRYNAQSLGINLTNGEVGTLDQAEAIAEAYTQQIDQNVVVDEVHEFSNGYEAEFKDVKTGTNAYEIMISKNGGQIIPEMGPNIMWNTKYGPMNNWSSAGAVTISEEQATKNAQDFVTKMGQGYSLEKPELAPGYYEFMIQKDGKDYSELDVNGYTGQVWLENWQGPIINTIEVK